MTTTDAITTLAFLAAYALTLVAIATLCYRSKTARRWSDAYDRFDWR